MDHTCTIWHQLIDKSYKSVSLSLCLSLCLTLSLSLSLSLSLCLSLSLSLSGSLSLIYNVSISLSPSNEKTLDNIRTKDIIKQQQKSIHCFSEMQLKLGFSIERKGYIYNISITLSPLYLHIYSGVPWRGVGVGGWGWGWGGGNVQLLLFCSIEIHSTSSCHLFLSDLLLLWQCKKILSSKQNHKFKHTNAASTKPLGWIKFIFLTPLFWYQHTTAYNV